METSHQNSAAHVRARRMSSRRNFLRQGASAAAVVSLGTGRIARAAAQDVVVAGLYSLTGPASQFGVRNARGEKIVYDLVNERGGIKSLGGARIKHLLMDTESKIDVAAIRAESLASQGAVVVTGTGQTAVSLVVSQVCERVSVPFLSVLDLEPSLTARGFKYTFRSSIYLEDIGRDLIDFVARAAKDSGTAVRKVGIVCADDVAGVGTSKLLARQSKDKGWDVVENILYNAVSTKDFTGIVSRLKRNGADVLMGHNKVQDSILLTRTCVELDFNPMGVVAALGGAVSNSFSEALKEHSDNIVVVQPFSNDLKVPGLDDFRARYKALSGEEADLSSVAAASAAAIVVNALERAASKDPKAIRAAMAATDIGLDGTVFLPNGCKYDENGNNVRAMSLVTQYKDGRLRTVAPKEFAAAKPVWPKPKWARER